MADEDVDRKRHPRDSRLPPLPPTRYEGWLDFVTRTAPTRVAPPSPEDWEAMSKSEKKSSRNARTLWHDRMPPIKTATLRRIIREVLEQARSSYRSRPGVRPGFVLDGLATLGKTTILMELGRRYEEAIRKALGVSPYEDIGHSTFLPVAYVTLPAKTTISAFDTQFVVFYGLPVKKRIIEEVRGPAYADKACSCGASLILIDDIHFLRMKNKSAQDLNNHIKALESQIPATFVFAGINLDETGFLTEGMNEAKEDLSQTNHRLTRYEIKPHDIDDPELVMLLKAYEQRLSLVYQQPGDLIKLKAYIHGRTGGFIGAINQLLVRGANLAIKLGVERLSQELLDKIRLSNAAESRRKTRNRRN